ncbi:hypothetical protein ACFV0R_25535 [Streptomyces sp. NPDC059578]|uniref:hypothetical protein n=1 Tax=Streptomyces sp. NPDC059578 TaxID=3346874 RepID=UPI00367B644E
MGLFDVDGNPPASGGGGLLAGGLPAAAAASVVIKAPPGTTLSSIPAPYQPVGEGDLNEQERQDFEACKAGMDNLHNAFWIAGKSLETMKTANLARQEHTNFAEWVWITWEISESQMHRLTDEWRVGEALANLGHRPLESHVRMLTELRRQTNDSVGVAVYDTIARCVPRVTGKIVEEVAKKLLPTLPKDIDAAAAGNRVRQLLQKPSSGPADAKPGADVPDITSLSKDSPNGESQSEPSNAKAETSNAKDIERLTEALAALRQAAKKVSKAATRRVVDNNPEEAVPLVNSIGAVLQQIDKAVSVRLPDTK